MRWGIDNIRLGLWTSDTFETPTFVGQARAKSDICLIVKDLD